jgi:hypothetical protein
MSTETDKAFENGVFKGKMEAKISDMRDDIDKLGESLRAVHERINNLPVNGMSKVKQGSIAGGAGISAALIIKLIENFLK